MSNTTLQIIIQTSVHCKGDTQGPENTLWAILEWWEDWTVNEKIIFWPRLRQTPYVILEIIQQGNTVFRPQMVPTMT